MNRTLAAAAFFLGAGAVAWVGLGFLHSPVALLVTGLIGLAYAAGATELWHFHRATGSLSTALHTLQGQARGDDTAPPPLSWLAGLHPTLQRPVRLRIEGERLALPGPVLTPYLVGLLVLLGMLGTFLGMVVTMQGAVLALQSTTDLATIRSALSAPVRGLGLAFGTSVAGVGASAMLGLLAALCRRERLLAAEWLDRLAATQLRSCSQGHQREQTLAALQAVQAQTQALPQVLEHLQALALQATTQAQATNEALLRSQADFHQQAQARTAALADALEQHMKLGLQEGFRLAGDTLRPWLEDTLRGLAQQAAAQQQVAATTLQQQLEGQATAFEQHQAALLDRLTRAQTEQQAQAAAADQERQAQWAAHLAATAASLRQAWQAAGQQAQAQQAQICETLAHTAQGLQAQAETHARSTLAELSRLAHTAAEAPQAAAELVHTLRQKLSDSLAQDQVHLTERAQLTGQLSGLLDQLQQQADAQRRATEELLSASAQQLQQAATHFQTGLAADTGKLAEAATEISASAIDMASLADAFGAAVQLFGDTSGALAAQLQQIEMALARSTARSDEQLAYYVAQAREVIDLSITSQQHIVQDLRQLAQSRQAQPADVT
jgi:hypothetical protein